MRGSGVRVYARDARQSRRSQVETLVENGRGDEDARDQTGWCVGITLDPKLGKIYWSQKGPDNANLGRILLANIEISPGESPAHRSDIEVQFDGLPEVLCRPWKASTSFA